MYFIYIKLFLNFLKMIYENNVQILILFLKFIIIIIFILDNIKFFSHIKTFILFMRRRNEIKNIDTYLKYCKSQKLEFQKYKNINNKYNKKI